MSENIRYDTEELRALLRLLGEYADQFEGARVQVGHSMELNLETAGVTELGKVYAEGIGPGARSLAQLLDLIREQLEGAHGNGIDMTAYLEDISGLASDIAGRGRGGRR